MSGSGPARELNRSRMAAAALKNEYLTRERVNDLEQLATLLNERVRSHEEWLGNRQFLHGTQVKVFLDPAPASGLVERMKRAEAVLNSGFWGRLCWLLLGR
jgi:hypothetical protein